MKENGGMCPISVGCTIRKLASKCVYMPPCHSHYSRISGLLPVGIWIPGGVEGAVYARIYLHNLPSNKTLILVDLDNAFNRVRQGKMFCAVKRFVHSRIIAL